MTRTIDHRMLVAVLVTGLALAFLPATSAAETTKWLDEITGFVMIQKEIARAGSFDPYFEQLGQVRHALKASDHRGTYVAMNRFMDMLEAREGGIGSEAADAIWDYCYRVTPGWFHDVSRHLKANPDYLKEWEAFRAMEERAAISF